MFEYVQLSLFWKWYKITSVISNNVGRRQKTLHSKVSLFLLFPPPTIQHTWTYTLSLNHRHNVLPYLLLSIAHFYCLIVDANLIGCFRDKGDRAMKGKMVFGDNDMSNDKCITLCKQEVSETVF